MRRVPLAILLWTLAGGAWLLPSGWAQSQDPASSDGLIVGAIRWDAWHGPASEVGLLVEKTLAPARWHYRLPFYGRITGENTVEARGNTREIMDREIEYAHHAGLDYWAFVVYPETHALSDGLRLYLSSPIKDRIHFCLILQGGWEGRGGLSAWPEKARRYTALFRDPMYQAVLDGRPLVFLYSVDDLVGPGRFESWEQARAAMDSLRNMARDSGAGEPYIVAQGWSPETLARQADLLGLDAIGAYASNGGARAAPYRALADYTERWWDAFAATRREVIPLVTAGWDMRPRVETPVPWVRGGDMEQYYAPPLPGELAVHARNALVWVRDHPDVARARTVLMYAWNEFDEGGWICPTLREGTARLDALRAVLRPESRTETPKPGHGP